MVSGGLRTKMATKQYQVGIPLVTIITVVRNGENTLEETILSVINQTYKNIEYIIVDGASTDGTLDIIKKYEDKLDYWISEPDEGIYYAMNKGINLVTGEWINFMNSGDKLESKTVMESVSKYLISKSDIVFGLKKGQENYKTNFIVNRYYLFKKIGICHQVIFARKSRLICGFNVEYKLASDFDWILSSMISGAKFKPIDIIIVDYEGGGISERNRKQLYSEFYDILRKYFPILIVLLRKLLWYIKFNDLR